MIKALSLILALVLCLSLCACGGGEQNSETQGSNNNDNSQVNGDTTGGSDTPNTDDSNDQTIKNTLCGIRWEHISSPDMFGTEFRDDGSYYPAAGGDQIGMWTVDGDIISMTKTGSSQTLDYQLKVYGDIYFLVGQQDTLASVSENNIPSRVPTKQVNISMDNWQEYFEFTTFTQVSKKIDLFGAQTEETATFGVLKLKDEYARYLVEIVSKTKSTFAINDRVESRYMNSNLTNSILDYPKPGGTYAKYAADQVHYYGISVELDEGQANDASFEMMEIEGTVCFIDIE